jgi:hypothetical protein
MRGPHDASCTRSAEVLCHTPPGPARGAWTYREGPRWAQARLSSDPERLRSLTSSRMSGLPVSTPVGIAHFRWKTLTELRGNEKKTKAQPFHSLSPFLITVAPFNVRKTRL